MGAPKLGAAIYARYSSEHQREASIEDQVRNCRRYATDLKIEVLEDLDRLDTHGKAKVTGYEIYITPEEAPTVRRIFESYLAGTSPRAIAAQLNKEGVPNSVAKGRKTRHGWSGSTIATMLDNPKYMGDWTWNKTRWVRDADTGKKRPLHRPEREWVPFFNEHLAIIDKPTWKAVQARRNHLCHKYTHTRATQPKGKKGTLRGLKGQPGYGKYLLSGLLTCGVCGHAMIVAGSPVRRLTCGAHRDKGSSVCPNGASIRMDLAEKAILDRLEAEVLTNEAMDRIVDKVVAKFKALPDLEPKRQEELLQRKRKLEGEVANLVAFVARGNDIEEVEQAIKQAKAQIKVIDQELDLQKARAQRKINPPTKAETKKALRSYRKLIRAEVPRANLALKALLGKVEMHPKGTGRAVSYVARCNLKLGEILLPSVSTYGSGERI